MRLKHLLREVSNFYTRAFLIIIVSTTVVLLIPITAVYRFVAFDEVTFANTYLSTIFTAVLISVMLQFLEFYRSTAANHKRVRMQLTVMKNLIVKIHSGIATPDHTLKCNLQLLEHYKNNLLSLLQGSKEMNEKIISLYHRGEFKYLNDSVNTMQAWSAREMELLQGEISNLIVEVENIISTI